MTEKLMVDRFDAWPYRPDLVEQKGESRQSAVASPHSLTIYADRRTARPICVLLNLYWVRCHFCHFSSGSHDLPVDRLEVTVWAVPSLIENAVAVSFIGLLMGPMYPILVNHAQNVLPRWLLTGSIGWIAGIGQAGSAILPLITGVLASKFGIGSLQPL